MLGLILGIVFAVLCIVFWIVCVESYTSNSSGWLAFLFAVFCIVSFCTIPLTGVINYAETNDYDKARITAVDTIQTPFRVYYKVDVEYLTNTPTTNGVITNYNSEKDVYYTDNGELVKTMREIIYFLWVKSA